MMHVLLDSDVLLNVYLQNVLGHARPQSTESAEVIASAVRGRIMAYLTPTAYSNVYYILRKSFTVSKANSMAFDLLDAVNIIGQDEIIFRNALESGWADVEDAGQYFAAKADPRITHLCTTNHKHYKASKGIAIVSPAALLKLL